jgi:hypothetical protein
MAFQTPSHLKAGVLKHQGHAIHLAMAGHAAYSLVDVNIVREINKIGQIMNTSPFDRDFIAPAFTDRLKDGGIGPNPRMAGYAGFSGRQTGKCGIGD